MTDFTSKLVGLSCLNWQKSYVLIWTFTIAHSLLIKDNIFYILTICNLFKTCVLWFVMQYCVPFIGKRNTIWFVLRKKMPIYYFLSLQSQINIFSALFSLVWIFPSFCKPANPSHCCGVRILIKKIWRVGVGFTTVLCNLRKSHPVN